MPSAPSSSRSWPARGLTAPTSRRAWPRPSSSAPTGDDDSIPKPLAEILLKSLARDPGSRYGEMQEMRKAIDTLLFSGDFTPTTFNLAFFMHSLYREDIEREARALKEDKEASYLEYLPTDTSRSGAHAAPPAPSSKTEPVDPRLLAAVRAADAADAAAARRRFTSPLPALRTRRPPILRILRTRAARACPPRKRPPASPFTRKSRRERARPRSSSASGQWWWWPRPQATFCSAGPPRLRRFPARPSPP